MSGCQPEEGISTYTIPKDIPQQLLPGKERMLAVMVPRGEQVWFFKVTGPEASIEGVEEAFTKFVSNIQFTDAEEPDLLKLPAGWQRGGKKAMRFATVYINTPGKQLELSVSSLPAFGEWDEYVQRNVNRWRGQLSLEDSDQQWAGGEAVEIESASGQSILVDIVGMPPSGTGGAGPMMGMTSPSAGPPPAVGDSASGETESKESELKFERPDGWRDGRKSSMRLASFNAGPEEEQAEVTVIPAGGDLRGNVARWMGQVIGQTPEDPAVDEMLASAEKLTVAGREGQRFMIEGDPSKGQQSIDATIVPMGGGFSMFVKMTGPAKTVKEQSDSMRLFLESLSF